MAFILPPSSEETLRIVLSALAEDIGHGDITSRLTITESVRQKLKVVAREPMVVSGMGVALMACEAVDPMTELVAYVADGTAVEAGAVLADLVGDARSLLAAERVALNLLQRMSGIATETARYVQAVAGLKCAILDTRKTAPGLRELDKYAVRCGGGRNHRMRLDDAILIKDNHIALVGSLGEAVRRAVSQAPAAMQVEVECDTPDQVREAIAAGAHAVLLDNMTLDELRDSVALAQAAGIATEASGNMTLERVRLVAETGVDMISIGRLTHSVRAVDIGLDAAA